MNRRRLVQTGTSLAALALMAAPAETADIVLHVPPEEAPHEATFLQWPVIRSAYEGPDHLWDVQDTIAELASTIAEFEPAILLVAPEHMANARARVSSRVTLWDIPTDDLWCRDSGPLTAIDGDGRRVLSHIRFNGWGDKQPVPNDRNVAVAVADRLGFPVVSSGLVGEPGGVEHGANGRLLAHESSWVNTNRNPGLSRQEIGERLMRAYGATEMIWSTGVWGEDITDYHIDSLARITPDGSVLINLPIRPDPTDPFHQAALETRNRVAAAGLRIVEIPEPERRRIDDIDFVASYANYYVCNGGLMLAQFGDPDTDDEAARTLSRLYPGREVIRLNADELGWLGGGIHCATQQLPRI